LPAAQFAPTPGATIVGGTDAAQSMSVVQPTVASAPEPPPLLPPPVVPPSLLPLPAPASPPPLLHEPVNNAAAIATTTPTDDLLPLI
jgi:hypothetical protein